LVYSNYIELWRHFKSDGLNIATVKRGTL